MNVKKILLGALLLTACGTSYNPTYGEPCQDWQANACHDTSHLLWCNRGSWDVHTCVGAQTCNEALDEMCTRERSGIAGEHCFNTTGQDACSVDFTQVLTCTSGVWTVKQACGAAPHRCYLDPSLASVAVCR